MATTLPLTHSPPSHEHQHATLQHTTSQQDQDSDSSRTSIKQHPDIAPSDLLQASCPKCEQFWEFGKCSAWYRRKYDHVGNAAFNKKPLEWLHEFPYYARWFRRGWPSIFEHWIHTERLWGYPSAPVLYMASTSGAASPITSSTLLLDGPETPPALTEALTAKPPGSTNVFLLPDLNLVTMDRLGSLFSIHPSVFLSHLSTVVRIDDENIGRFSLVSPHHCGLVPTANTSTFDCPGDLWALSPYSCIPKASEGTFGAQRWPLDVSWTAWETWIGSFNRDEADASTTSRTTFHVWTSRGNITNVLVLVRPWHRVKAAVMKTTAGQVSFEYGHASSVWNEKLLHVDGDPLHMPEEPGSPSSSDPNKHLCFDATYRNLCHNLAVAACTSRHNPSPESSMDGMLDFAWSRTAERIDVLLQRCRYRLKAFRFRRRDAHVAHDPRERSELQLAIVFLERNLLDQLEAVDFFRTQLDRRSIRHAQVQPPDARPRGHMDRLTDRLKDLAQQCQRERELHERKQQEDLTKLQLKESRKTIEQTDQVKKLTVLAFFFIPISCVTSAFGMNLDVYDRAPPTVVSFVAATLVITGVTMLLALLPTLRLVDNGIRGQLFRRRLRTHQTRERLPHSPSAQLKHAGMALLDGLYVVVLTGPLRCAVKLVDVLSMALRHLHDDGQRGVVRAG